MIYVNDQNHLDANAIQVAEPNEVDGLVLQGWRILAVFSTQEPEIVRIEKPITVVSETQQYAIPPGVPHDVPIVVSKLWFIMGRSEEAKSLAGRLQHAESEYRNAEQNVMALEAMRTKTDAEIESLKQGKHVAMDNVKIQTEIATRATEKIVELQRQAGLVRKEVGEAKWREILHALEIEDVLGRPA